MGVMWKVKEEMRRNDSLPFLGLIPCSCCSPLVTSGVPVIVAHLNELIDNVQQVVVVFVQQALVQGPIPKAHLHQHGHHGVLCGCVHWRLQKTRCGQHWENQQNRDAATADLGGTLSGEQSFVGRSSHWQSSFHQAAGDPRVPEETQCLPH